MRKEAVYAIALLLGCRISAAQGQSYGEQKAHLLPAAKHGQPAFSFEGGKRISVQKNRPPGLHEYGAGGSASSGTGIVEIGPHGASGRSSSHIAEFGLHGQAPGAATSFDTTTGITVMPASSGKLVDRTGLTGSGRHAFGGVGKSKQKPATTVVQILGPDGKMEYKAVPFIGTVPANKRAPNITNVKDGEGKVKEYDWVKKRQ